MNTFRIISTVCVLATSAWLLKAEPAPSAPSTPPSPVAPKEDLGYDIVDGKTNKIDRVVQADPRFVWVLYENDSGTRRIPRDELPPTLAAKYPYDPKKAQAFIDSQNAQAKQGQATSIALQKQTLEIREKGYLSQINDLKEKQRDVDDNLKTVTKEIDTTTKKRKTNFRTQKIDLLKQQGDLREQMQKLEDSLKETRNQLDALP